MSKRNPKDKSIYQFASFGTGKWTHGEIVFDVDKNTTCPNCKEEYNFGRLKVIKIFPGYVNAYGQDCFYTEIEVNTPSADCRGNGDKLPRFSHVIKGCRLVIEDKIHDSRPKESINFRGSQLEFKDIYMPKEYEMEYSNCCTAPFGEPGWPECDICSACGEHAEPSKEDEV
tara:strand:- start:495 stop:1007 length:513 start_codon:yes stop_codon:yes gene_type:complete